MPTARQPWILAIWPTTLPTAPAAPDTTTVLPATGLPMSSRPKYAVRPGMPSVLSITGSGTSPGDSRGSIGVTPSPLEIAYSCRPNVPRTCVPTASCGCFDSTTLPIAPARITSPIATGRMYDLPSFIQPRIAGSSEMYRTLTRISPSPSSRTASSPNAKSVALGSPTGRAASVKR